MSLNALVSHGVQEYLDLYDQSVHLGTTQVAFSIHTASTLHDTTAEFTMDDSALPHVKGAWWGWA
jgi:hypothetical protein